MATSPEAESFGNYLAWKDWSAEAFGRFTPEEAAYFVAETAIRAGNAQRVLELGFGNGQLLGWLVSIGVEAYGVEANPHLVTHARRLLGETRAYEDLAALRPLAGSFSHVVAMDVLEHVQQDSLEGLLGDLAALLAPHGHIVARFPNGDSPFGRIHQHGDPTHVTTIGRGKLEYFARRAGLEVTELRAPALPHGGFGARRAARRFALRTARAVVERLVGLLYFGGRRVPLEPNYVAVLTRQKPGRLRA